MSPTGFEVQFYAAIQRIDRSLKRIADSLDLLAAAAVENKPYLYDEAQVVREYRTRPAGGES
jgi:hypothetical protein